MSAGVVAQGPTEVPFSPIPTHHVPMRFEPDGFTYDDVPMMKLSERNYRAAVLFRSDEARSRVLGDQAIALEDAYMARSRAEWLAEQAAKAVSA